MGLNSVPSKILTFRSPATATHLHPSSSPGETGESIILLLKVQNTLEISSVLQTHTYFLKPCTYCTFYKPVANGFIVYRFCCVFFASACSAKECFYLSLLAKRSENLACKITSLHIRKCFLLLFVDFGSEILCVVCVPQ